MSKGTQSGRCVEKDNLLPLRGFEHRTVHPVTARRKYLSRCQRLQCYSVPADCSAAQCLQTAVLHSAWRLTTVLLNGCTLRCCTVPADCSTAQCLQTVVLHSACRVQYCTVPGDCSTAQCLQIAVLHSACRL